MVDEFVGSFATVLCLHTLGAQVEGDGSSVTEGMIKWWTDRIPVATFRFGVAVGGSIWRIALRNPELSFLVAMSVAFGVLGASLRREGLHRAS